MCVYVSMCVCIYKNIYIYKHIYIYILDSWILLASVDILLNAYA